MSADRIAGSACGTRGLGRVIERLGAKRLILQDLRAEQYMRWGQQLQASTSERKVSSIRNCGQQYMRFRRGGSARARHLGAERHVLQDLRGVQWEWSHVLQNCQGRHGS